MASIGKDPNGYRRILFVAPDGKRKTIRLGKATQRTAEGVKTKVEALVVSALTGSPMEDEVARWVAGLDSTMADKLAKVGLIGKQKRATLAAFLDNYVDGRPDWKGSTATVYGHTRRCLVDYFGAEKPLHEITADDAAQWRAWLSSHEKLADNTVRRRSGIAKQFFRAAVRQKLIHESPFTDLVAAVRRNEKRYYFISRPEAQAVLDACPDAQWRLLFVLSRFGGLRCPSEHLGLRWGDVDWERGRITVHSPKTEHHEGGASRQIPIFPEIRPYLEEVWEQAEPGTEWVITRYRDTNGNLRTQLQRIIERAGLKAWPKLFQNLRATRETELAETYPIQVVCEWIGNTAAVAAKHYLQVTDEHYRQALDAPKSAAQNPAQYTSEIGCNRSQQETQNPGFSGVCDALRCCTNDQVGAPRLEHGTSSLSGTRSNQLSYAPKSDILHQDERLSNPVVTIGAVTGGGGQFRGVPDGSLRGRCRAIVSGNRDRSGLKMPETAYLSGRSFQRVPVRETP